MDDLTFYKKSLRPDRQESYKAIVKYILKNIAPDARSVVEYGCGAGWFLYNFKKRGVTELLGFEPNLTVISEIADSSIFEHLKKGSLIRKIYLEKDYDIAMCIEVAEHVNKRWANLICENITRHSNLLIFSAAYPGQGGRGHVNEQPFKYWEEKLNNKEFFLDVEGTKAFRRYLKDRKAKSWYIRNISIFRKRSTENEVS